MKSESCTMADAFIGLLIGFVVWATVVWICGVVL
jgi:tetrahydromethanopterin S-methyltransferase subunit F